MQVAWTDHKLAVAVIAPLLVWPWLPHWDSDYIKGGTVGVIAWFALIAVAEEALFRGVIQGWLLSREWFQRITWGLSRANWLTSVAFASAHLWQQPLFLIPGYFAVSLVLGYFRERYRGILVPILLHGYYNLGLLFFG